MLNPDRLSRLEKVLEHIIIVYIELGIPVGSVTLRDRASLDLSPATIRNIMSELEEMGFIAQPHTSAGRTPTDLGYRYYLDKIMQPEAVKESDKDRIYHVCDSSKDGLDILLEKMSKLLSEMSSEASLVLFPKSKKNTLKEIKLVSFGWYHLLEQPEFKDTLKTNRLLKVIEEKEELMDSVEAGKAGKEVRVFIGAENRCIQIKDCSVVLSGYGADDESIGAIGVIGPTRMPYKRVVPMVDFIAKQIDEVFESGL